MYYSYIEECWYYTRDTVLEYQKEIDGFGPCAKC